MAWAFGISFLIAGIVSSAAGATFQVQVGENTMLTFDPETITAQPGDTVTYKFHPKVRCPLYSSFIHAHQTLCRIIPSHNPPSKIHAIP
jgi:hypothetical protein